MAKDKKNCLFCCSVGVLLPYVCCSCQYVVLLTLSAQCERSKEMAAVLGLTAPGLRLSYRSLGLSALSFGLSTPADGRVDP